jgi:branched-chain amino acid aminotransferase
VIVVGFELEPTSPTASVMVVPWTRNEGGALAGLKTISYAENVRALAYVEERGAHEAVFPNTQGNLCEATGSNVFLVLDGECCTPPLTAGCLNGVTRQLLLVLGEEIGVPIAERDVPVGALGQADEAFVSSTVREVQPVATVDGVALPQCPGPITSRLAAAFTALTKRDLDP